jgi:hypothetical protein
MFNHPPCFWVVLEVYFGLRYSLVVVVGAFFRQFVEIFLSRRNLPAIIVLGWYSSSTLAEREGSWLFVLGFQNLVLGAHPSTFYGSVFLALEGRGNVPQLGLIMISRSETRLVVLVLACKNCLVLILPPLFLVRVWCWFLYKEGLALSGPPRASCLRLQYNMMMNQL